MFCRSCGATVRDGVRFCAQCGAAMPQQPLSGQPAPEPVITGPIAPMPAVAPAAAPVVANPPRTRMRWIAPIVVAFVVLALVAGGVVAWRMGIVGKQDTASSQSAKGSTLIDDAAEPASDGDVDQANVDAPVAPAIAKPLALGTPERATIMDAIHLWRGTTKTAEPFYVNRGTQIFIQGEYVVCDLATSPKGANRMFVALKGTPWKVVWSAPAASTSANESELKQAVPDIPADIVSEIDWSLAWAAKK